MNPERFLFKKVKIKKNYNLIILRNLELLNECYLSHHNGQDFEFPILSLVYSPVVIPHRQAPLAVHESWNLKKRVGNGCVKDVC